MTLEATIRLALRDDLLSITDIYNEAIINSVATFDTKPRTIENQIRWFENRGDRHPILVAELNKEIIGWASLSSWSDRCAYADTAEISTYIHKEFRNLGIGQKLKAALIDKARIAGIHVIISRVTKNNKASEELNKKLGFIFIGTMHEVGKKFGNHHDVHLYQVILR